jgi:hypothetical protein
MTKKVRSHFAVERTRCRPRSDFAMERKRRLERERQNKERRAAGAMLRAEYEANSLSRTRPWDAEGISRATWYRRRAARLENQGARP